MHPLTWLGLIFIFLGTGLTIYGQQIIFDKSNALLQNKSDIIEDLSKENIRLNSEIAKINKEIAATITGGDSFCYLFASLSFDSKNTINFDLHHNGEYPMYEVSVKVWDESCLKKINFPQLYEKHFGYRTKELTLEEWQKMKEDPESIDKNIEHHREMKELMRNCLIVNEELGTIIPDKRQNIMDQSLVSYTIPQGIDLNQFSQEYDVVIVARNGLYKQKIELDVRNKKWHVYSKVEKVISGSDRVVVREYESQDAEGFVIKLLK